MATEDFDVLKTLWTQVNNACVPPQPPGQSPKAFFLMEMPGFSVDPNAFNPSKFNPGTMMSPDCATASLCDRVPALARYFYDTGNHISFFWNLLLETFTLEGNFDKKNTEVEARYERAIEMLYGSKEGYKRQEKTPFYQGVSRLRDVWKRAQRNQESFKKKCMEDEENWPGNYEKGAAPYVDAVEQAYTEYNNLSLQIDKYESAIFAYCMGDLNTVLLNQEIKMAQHRRDDAGSTGAMFYQTTLNPGNWYKWFESGSAADPSSEDPEDPSTKGTEEDPDAGWTEIKISQSRLSQSTEDTFSNMSFEAGGSYGGLVSVSSGYSKDEGSSSLAVSGSNLEISFKIRKVTIQRPWIDPTILNYPIIGIKGLPAGAWSSGELNGKTNKGSFPLLPTAMIVAKDVTISSDKFSESLKESFSEMSTHASVKVGIGPFSAKGNFGYSTGTKSSNSEMSSDGRSINIHGAQIIGWVCVVNPHFPPVDCRLPPKK